MLEKYLEDENSVTADDLKQAIRKATIHDGLVPVLTGSAFKNKGVQPLLDAVVDYMPSPLDLPPIDGHGPEGQGGARAQGRRQRAVLGPRVQDRRRPPRQSHLLPGLLGAGSRRARPILNSRTGKKERVGRILLMHANNREDIDVAKAGDIVAGIGLKDTRTGDTLSDDKAPIVLEQMVFPEPVIHVAVEPKTKADQDKMGKALFSLSEEDPTFTGPHRRGHRPDDHRRHGRAAPRGARRPHAPRVHGRGQRRQAPGRLPGDHHRPPSRSTATRHKKQTGGSGQFADVILMLEPTGAGGGYEFVDKVTGGRIPKEYIPAVDYGIQQALTSGVLADYPMVDVRVTLLDGSYHDVDSSEMAFRTAGLMGFKEAARKAKPVLLEPIMAVEVVTPEDYMGDVMGDLSSPPRSAHGHRAAGQRHRDPGPRAAVGDVRLRGRPAQPHPGSGHLHDAVRQLPAGADSVQEEIVKRVRGE